MRIRNLLCRPGVPMPPRLEVIAGGKPVPAESPSSAARGVMAEVELIVVHYVEGVLAQLEELAGVMKVDGLAKSIGTARQDARDIVQRLADPG